MSNYIQQAKDNVNQLSENIIGPPYDYKSKIKTTRELGMSDKGDLPTLENDVRGIVGYMKVLIEGGGRASKVNGPLGNKFFMKTAMLCKDTATKKEVPRYIYINNVPNPPLPGLIKGTTTGLEAINPFRIMGAFSDATTPDCKKVTLEVIDSNNRKSRETNYMTLNDIKYMREGFETVDDTDENEGIDDNVALPDDMFIQAYYVTLAAFGVYIVYRLMHK